MAYADLREFADALEKQKELKRIKTEVDWDLEMGAITRRAIDLRAPAPLFEKVKGYPDGYRVLGIPLGPSKPVLQGRVAVAIGLPKETPTLEIIDTFRDRLSSPIKPMLVNNAPCKEVILKGKDVDVTKLPVPRVHGVDGGRYIGTWDIIISKDLETNWVNWGIYRSMVFDSKTLCILLTPGDQHGGAMFYHQYEPRKKNMPVAIVVGAEPVCHLIGTTPTPHGSSDADVAGGIRQAPVTLIKCETSDLEVPASAEIVIEGEVLAGERRAEGPFGEYTGHSVHDEQTPIIRVNCITHRKDPIITMANMGKPWDDYATPTSITVSASVGKILQDSGVPFKSVFQPAPGTSMVISIRPRPGLIQKIVSILAGAERMGFSYYVLVDEDVDVTSMEEVWWAITTRMHPRTGTHVLGGVGANTLLPYLSPEDRETHQTDHMYMDATFPYHWTEDYRRQHCQVVDFARGWPEEVKKKVLAKWKTDYGYED